MKKQYLVMAIAFLTIQVFTLALLLPLAVEARSDVRENTAAAAGVPALMNYQGYLTNSNDKPLNDSSVSMQFNITDAEGTPVWGQTATDVNVENGLFTVPLSPGVGVFENTDRWLEVSVEGTPMPRQQLGAVPYAMQAATLNLENVVYVAKSGGDYNTIQAAIDSIHDADSANPYLVWVAPGTYNETVVMKPYVSLQGAGVKTTTISSEDGDESSNISTATLQLASNANLQDIRVLNSGVHAHNVAILGKAGVAGIELQNVNANAHGAGTTNNYGIYLVDSGTNLKLTNVIAVASGAASRNYGLFNTGGARAALFGGTYNGKAGSNAGIGIYNQGSGTSLDTTEISVAGYCNNQAEDACTTSSLNIGMSNVSGASATLKGGFFSGRGGVDSRGLHNDDGSTLSTYQTYATGSNSPSPVGLYAQGGSTTYVTGGVLSAVNNPDAPTAGTALRVVEANTAVTVVHALFWGPGNIFNYDSAAGSSLGIRLSQFGGVPGVGTATCSGISFDNTFLPSACAP